MRRLVVFAVLLAVGCGRERLSPVPVDPPETEEPPAGVVDLVVAIDDEVLYASGDGAQVRSVYRFPPPEITATTLGSAALSVDVDGSGRHVIATRSVGGFVSGETWQQGDRAVLLDGAGRVAWTTSFTAGELGPSHARTFAGRVGDGGQAVLAVGGQRLFVAPDGGAQVLVGVSDAYAPLPGPIVPVVADATAPVPFSFGWWRPGEGTDLIGYRMAALLHASPTEARFVFRSEDATGAPLVVDARPSSLETRPWPAALGDTITRFGAGIWQGDDHGREVARWNVLTDARALLPWSLPAGLRLLGAPSFDADGALIVALRNDYTAAVYRSAAAGPDWVPIGKTLGDVESVSVREAGGTYVVDTIGTNDRFVPEQTWAPATLGMEPALRGRSHQIVRPADGISVEATPAVWTIALSPDGRRALYWETAGPDHVLVLHDLATGTKRPLAARARPSAYRIVWRR